MDHMTDKNLQARLRRAFGQFWKYCLVGASGFVINLLVYSLMIAGLEVHYWLAATVSLA